MSNYVHWITVPHRAGALALAMKQAQGRFCSYWNLDSAGTHGRGASTIWQLRNAPHNHSSSRLQNHQLLADRVAHVAMGALQASCGFGFADLGFQHDERNRDAHPGIA